MMGLEEFGLNEIVFLGSYYVELFLVLITNNILLGGVLIILSLIIYGFFEERRKIGEINGNR